MSQSSPGGRGRGARDGIGGRSGSYSSHGDGGNWKDGGFGRGGGSGSRSHLFNGGASADPGELYALLCLTNGGHRHRNLAIVNKTG